MKGVFKIGDSIKDTVTCKLPDTSELKKELKVLRDSNQKRYLEIEVDVTHGGYVNKNGYYYTPEGQAKAALSFYTPYPKPVLVHHDGGRDPIGRTYAAAFVMLPTAVDANTRNDLTVPKSKIRVKSIITDEDAIEKILDKRYMTVSSGGSAETMPICSICGNPVDHEDCIHDRNKVYDGQKCYWKIGPMNYQEYSFENMPADHSDDHVASVVSVNLVQSDTAAGDVNGFDVAGAKEDALKTAKIKDSTDSLTTCKGCNTQFDYTKQTESEGGVECPNCKVRVNQTGDVLTKAAEPPAQDASAASSTDVTKELTDLQTKNAELTQKIAELTAQIDALNSEIAKLKADAQQKDAELATANTKVTDLQHEAKIRLAEKVIDISLIARRKLVKDIAIEKNPEERKRKYDAMRDELMKRTAESLSDSINDLGHEMVFDVNDFDRVGDPTAKDKQQDKTKTLNRVDLADKMFKKEVE